MSDQNGWKAKLADITWVEATVILVVFFTVLAVLDAVTPVDIFVHVERWLKSLVRLAGDLIRELRGATRGA